MTSSCPFLGIKDDPYTSLAYVDPANYCQAVSPAEPVDLTHQARFCISGRFTACPVNAAKAGLAPEMRHLPRAVRGRALAGAGRRPSRGWLLLVLVLALVPITFWLYSLYAPPTTPGVGAQFQETNGSAALLPSTQTPTPNFTPTHINALGITEETPSEVPPTPTLSPTLTQEPELVDEPQDEKPAPKDPANCTHPRGWVVYIVRSGDTLFGIALSHGISTAELRAANCLKGNSILVTGKRLYVPKKASPPKPTSTKPPAPTNTQPPAPTDTQPPAPSDTPVPDPTDPPPTESPPTQPPTIAPTDPPPPPTDPPPPPTQPPPPPTQPPTQPPPPPDTEAPPTSTTPPTDS